MKIAIATLMVVLASSCQQVDNYTPERSECAMNRREEVREIISSCFHRDADIIRGPLAVEQVESELAELGKSLSDENRSIIVGGPNWDRLKAKLKQGDELYFYRSDVRSWADLHGWEGYVVIRGKDIVDTLLISMN